MIKRLRLLSTIITGQVNRIAGSEYCVNCLATDAADGLCPDCRADLPRNLSACQSCALPLPETAEGLCCGECLKQPPPFTRARIPWRYEFPVNRMISRYKYRGQRHYGRPLMAGLASYLEEDFRAEPHLRPQALIAVPMHPARRRQRGFNQAQDVAEYLGRVLKIPVVSGVVRRTRKTQTQRGLDRSHRLRNLANAFVVEGVLPASVALVDDVVTTGATARALGSVLLAAGVERLELWALARTPAPVSGKHPAVPGPGGQWPDWRSALAIRYRKD